MSLQGSLDTFALPDVLVLLASTKKGGELHVAGHRSVAGARNNEVQGLLWFDDGMLVGYDVAKAPDAATALFELLRLSDGTFSFVAGAKPPTARPPVEVEPLIGEAKGFLDEWVEIETVVPSLSAALCLAAEAPAAHVTMRSEQWRLIVAIGGGCQVSRLVDDLGQGELFGCRAVKELIEAGLVGFGPAEQVAPEPLTTAAPLDITGKDDEEIIVPEEAPEPAASFFEPAGRAFASPDSLDRTPERSLESTPDSTSERTLDASISAGINAGLNDLEPAVNAFASAEAEGHGADEGQTFDSFEVPESLSAVAREAAAAYSPQLEAEETTVGTGADLDSLVTLPSRAKKNRAAAAAPKADPKPRTLSALVDEAGARNAKGDGQLPEAEALSRQLASLGEHPPVAATPAGEEPAAAPTEEVDGDEPLNRGLLLKFLSSVRN